MLKQQLNKFMSGLTQTALWTLKRYDYYVNHSVVHLHNPDFKHDPYPTYNTLRQRGAILASAANRGWVVSGYKEIEELLRDKRISNDLRKNTFLVNLIKFATGGIEVPMLDNPTMLNQDPPDHTRLRKLVATGFMHKYIDSLAPMIEQRVDELLDAIPLDANVIDFIQSLAGPLPAIVIAQMLGVPKTEQHKFERWSQDLLGLTEINNPEAIHLAAQANTDMRNYLATLTEIKRKQPGDDLISQLIAVEEAGDRLTLDELYSTCVLLLTAGHETTTRLIGNCLYLLLQDDKQMSIVRSSEHFLVNALEETLRIEPPVQNTVRFVDEAMVFRNRKLKSGQMVLLCIAAANRDPAINDQPDSFDVKRENIKHLSFGYGIHLCLGMSLARMEAKIALTKILQRYPNLTNAENKPSWGDNDFFRGLKTLRVSVV